MSITKVVRVINSCETIEQLNVAESYFRLWIVRLRKDIQSRLPRYVPQGLEEVTKNLALSEFNIKVNLPLKALEHKRSWLTFKAQHENHAPNLRS